MYAHCKKRTGMQHVGVLVLFVGFLFAAAPQSLSAQTYTVQEVVAELPVKTIVTVGEDGTLYVADIQTSRITRVTRSGSSEVILDPELVTELSSTNDSTPNLQGTIHDLLWHDSQLYLLHGNQLSLFHPENETFTTVVSDLPTVSEDRGKEIRIGNDGRVLIIVSATEAESVMVFEVIALSTPLPSPTPTVSPAPSPSVLPSPSPSASPTLSPSPTPVLSEEEWQQRREEMRQTLEGRMQLFQENMEQRMEELRNRLEQERQRIFSAAQQAQEQSQQGGGTQEQSQVQELWFEVTSE